MKSLQISMNVEELQNMDLVEVSLLLKTIVLNFVEKNVCENQKTINMLYKEKRILKALGK